MSAAIWLLSAIASGSPDVTFCHGGAPKSKGRPRVVRGRGGRVVTFTPRESAAAERALADAWRGALADPMAASLALACVFYRPNRQRIDVDNLIKLVLDAGTKAGAWHDDSQLVAIAARVELDRDNPRTEVALGTASATMER